ncbi:MAG TPA: pyridoxamine 5'-phosphate oxidase family protein [Actinocrinis sp.]|uniref:pyridoxamine 5'-phosphate oxidase family protein n=1 Tax=Actinocrinis sp. TaxID=1920516 RepID=UPI002DDC9324|nr:pyridoxamine 5'-phosphate oxidase family protein [Actinocrinis sp.]HEV2344677.1 pyridoxamine 5'-phosphate oxidase family protein [Actinocrinis sp.]
MEIDVNGLEVLSRAEAIALLETQEVGRLVYTRRALPAIRPVNYVVRGGAVLVWTGSTSSLGQAVRGAVVAFEADEFDRMSRSGWSVAVTGTARLVTDEAQLERARLEGPMPWAPGVKDYLICIPLMIVTGRWLGSRDGGTVVRDAVGAVP